MKLLRYVSAFIIVTAIGILYDRYKKKWGFLNNAWTVIKKEVHRS